MPIPAPAPALQHAYPQSLVAGVDEQVGGWKLYAGCHMPAPTTRAARGRQQAAHWGNLAHSPSPRAQGVRAMLKGNDAAVLHVLAALGVPAPIVRVWNLVRVQGPWPLA